MTTKNTTTALSELQPTKKMIVEKLNLGALMARKQKNGMINFYYRYHFDKTDQTHPIGPFNEKLNANSTVPNEQGHSIKSAIREAERLALEQKLLGTQNRSINEKQTEAKIEKAKQKIKEQKQKDKTLGALLELYQQTLTAHRTKINVKSHFKNIPQEYLTRQANQINYKEFTILINKISAKTVSIGDKVHVFLRAAYSQAYRPTSLLVPAEKFFDFEIEKNPLERIKASYKYNPEDTKPLSIDELKNYYSHLKNTDGFKAACLRLHCLLGGSRMSQLWTLKKSDTFLNPSNEFCSYLVLTDGKISKNSAANIKNKPYFLPITEAIEKELEILLKNATEGQFLFSANKGKTHICDGTFRTWAGKIQNKNPNKIPDFSPKRIRSAISILFDHLDVPLHVSNQIQSHGSLGVVERHYKWHDKNLKQKKEALDKLFLELNTPE